MADQLSHAQRSQLMARIKARDTSPERIVRSIVRDLGFNHRIHATKLPGTPDIVIGSVRTAIFVHGCFWHRHSCRRGRSCPSTDAAFWEAKFTKNIRRDQRAARALRRLGWSVIVVWECQTARVKRGGINLRLGRFLGLRPLA